MREAWERAAPPLEPRAASVAALVRAAFPGATPLRFEPARAGLVNDNFRLELDGAAPRFVLLRYWRRGPAQAGMEVALLRRLRPGLPVPEVIFARAADPDFGLPCALLEWMEGERLDLAAKGAGGVEVAALGRAAGALLARVHETTFARLGFFDEHLSPAAGYDASVEGQLAWLASTCAAPFARARFGDGLFDRLMAFVARRGAALASDWALKPCLSHGDYDPSNILVRRGPDGFEAAAALDWEFAFAGGPAFDFGHLLRPPLGDDARFIDALCAAYRAAGGVLPPDWREAARVADLLSWADFLAQPFCGAAAARSARDMIERLTGERVAPSRG
ncbi:phosphotransferase family protein [Methylocella sp.]|uniref:phosphotransferase family protein n=1 Tax=Methylocella sp. TaxID=1978226 RepID=UPI00378325D1